MGMFEPPNLLLSKKRLRYSWAKRSGNVTMKSELATHVKNTGFLNWALVKMLCTRIDEPLQISATVTIQMTPIVQEDSRREEDDDRAMTKA